ncbi:MAG: PIG-L deacetylase family protein [Candidatus Zixiibacteriota bacterium]
MLKLMCILAHPDDESLGMGGTLARYAGEGVQTYVVTATRGERGRYGDDGERPPLDVVGQRREQELRAAARVLGVREVSFLDYIDGDLDQADPEEAVAKIVREIRRVRPQVIVSFGPEGAYGHPDHIAISQFAASAAICAADPDFDDGADAQQAHRVSKMYYMIWTPAKWAAYQEAFRDLKTTIDGVERRATPWPAWVVTTVVDTHAHWQTAWKAIQCHKTQLTIYDKLAHLSDEHHAGLWGSQEFYRVFSSVNGGRRRETDLFEGLRID